MVARYERAGAGGLKLHLLPAAAAATTSPPAAPPPDPSGEAASTATDDGVNLPVPAFDSLVQLSVCGNVAGGERSLGRSLRDSSSTKALRYLGHELDETTPGQKVSVNLGTGDGLLARHTLVWHPGAGAVEVRTTVVNETNDVVRLEMLSSFCLAELRRGTGERASGNGRNGGLVVHRLRSGWSSEARLVSDPVEALHLERSWSDHAVNTERFGQVGTMPVRGFAPFVAIEDTSTGVTTAAQLVWGGSWQFEIYNRGEGVSLSGGLADWEFGHWRKDLAPGSSFTSPAAWLTVSEGGPDACAQRLTAMQELAPAPGRLQDLAPVANEWCTTWGRPTHDKVVAMADRLAGSEVKYLVIDAGWYQSKSGRWFDAHGDWQVDTEEFPAGLAATASAIRERGLVPGLWAELETVGSSSTAFSWTDHLHRRGGSPLTALERRFLDFRDPIVVSYLADGLVRLLKESGIGYLKIDYNETLGTGCDGAESEGEGLRQQVEAAHAFISRIKRDVPGIVIENCASGGHRLEPSLMALCDLGSCSDAFSCPEVPVIAANVNRLLPPHRSLVWVVLRPADDDREFVYKLASGLLGRPCLSGDLVELSEQQWLRARAMLGMYEHAAPRLSKGRWARFGPAVKRYSELTGWQGFVRFADDGRGALAVVHQFGGDPVPPVHFELPGGASWAVSRVFPEDAALGVRGAQLEWAAPGPFSAAAAWLEAGS